MNFFQGYAENKEILRCKTKDNNPQHYITDQDLRSSSHSVDIG